MARAKISEWRAKVLLSKALGETYVGVAINTNDIDESLIGSLVASGESTFVVKVDQAVKKRNKLGLVFLDVKPADIVSKILTLKEKGYQWVLVEPFVAHNDGDEHFLALERVEEGVVITLSEKGGVNVEENPEHLKKFTLRIPYDFSRLQAHFSDIDTLVKIVNCFDDNHFTYLEINPYIFDKDKMIIMDAAVEVDTSAEFFVRGAWAQNDIRSSKLGVNNIERAVEELGSKSPASLTLKVLNTDGSIFLLLSGGGASVVVADEISNLGFHDQMANYGEYSGNPSEEETYLYTKQLVKLLLASKSPKKVLLIAGGVANFTDVAKTFNGIIHALDDNVTELVNQGLRVFVRRGGPNEKAGLKIMKEFLSKSELNGGVYGSELSLSDIVVKATEGL